MLSRIYTWSEQIGLIGTIFATVAWPSIGSVLVVVVSGATALNLTVALILTVVLALLVGFSCLVSCWLISAHIEYHQRGYRVCLVTGDEWRYDEQIDGRTRSLPLVRRIIGSGYPAPSEVRLPDGELWRRLMPGWAHDRRAEIADRIGKCFGTEVGGLVVFKE
jgi:hypothetical protein